MATTSLEWTSTASNSGFTTPDNVAAADDSRATGAVAGDSMSIELDNAPGDYNDTNSGNTVTLRVQARRVGAVTRQKQVVLTLTNASGTPIQDSSLANITFTTADLGTSDVDYTSSAFTLADNYTSANVNSWRLQADVTEGGGMADSATVEIDYMAVITLDYDVTSQNFTATPSDGVDVGDSHLVGVGEYQTDGITLGEDFTTVWSSDFDADGVVLSDLAGRSFDASAADGVDVGDTSAAIRGFHVSATDGVDVGDAHVVGVGDAVADGVDLGDTAAFAEPGRSVTDGVTLGEDFTTVWSSDFDADGVVLSDSAAFANNTRTATDGVTLSDAPTYPVATQKSLTDGITLSEDFTTTVTVASEPTGVVLGDTASFPSDAARTATDGASLGDTAHADVGDSASDGVSLSDALAIMVGFNVTISDGALFGDSLGTGINTSATDGIQLGDTATGLTGDAVSIGLLEMFDKQCHTVTLSDKQAQYVELRDAASNTVGVSDG